MKIYKVQVETLPTAYFGTLREAQAYTDKHQHLGWIVSELRMPKTKPAILKWLAIYFQ